MMLFHLVAAWMHWKRCAWVSQCWRHVGNIWRVGSFAWPQWPMTGGYSCMNCVVVFLCWIGSEFSAFPRMVQSILWIMRLVLLYLIFMYSRIGVNGPTLRHWFSILVEISSLWCHSVAMLVGEYVVLFGLSQHWRVCWHWAMTKLSRLSSLSYLVLRCSRLSLKVCRIVRI
jgi:hypothetical protein